MTLERRTIALVPVDMARNRLTIDGTEVPQPSIEHSLVACEDCGTDAWIGPAQRLSHLFHGGRLSCYRCIVAAQPAGQPIDVRTLDLTADQRTRRRA